MKKCFIITIVMCMIIFNMSQVLAVGPTFPNNAKFNRGVSNVCYYVDPTVSAYTNYINQALNNWVDTGYGWNPIYVTPVASSYATHMDFYGRHESNDFIIGWGVLGYVSYWDINSNSIVNAPDEPTRDYYYTEINFNIDDVYRPEIVFRHEIGHAFGLAHSSSSYSIMFENVDGMNVSTVQLVDHDTINYLYN